MYKIKINYIIIIIFFLFVKSYYSKADIITVKQDGTGNYTLIQQGINAAENGDTVLVYPGIYYENINYNSKRITVASLYLSTQNKTYIHNTIIDGNKNGSCVMIMSGENNNTVLCGFTVQNGSGYGKYKRGGGIYIRNSNPVIENCIIKNNFAMYGGGIYCKNANIVLSGNSIIYNYSDGGGGIILVSDVNIVFDSINKNNIYLNHSGFGCDIKTNIICPMNIIVDTFTVFNPDYYFIFSNDNMGFPVNNVTINIDNEKIHPINADIYVNPNTGNDTNTGLTPETPLKTIWYAYKKIYPDSINGNTIFLSDGIYSKSNNNEKFPVNARSFVNLVGNGVNSTIIDAEEFTSLVKSRNNVKNYCIKNLSFINGNSISDYGDLMHCIYFGFNKNISIENIKISNCTQVYGGSLTSNTNNFYFINSIITGSKGGSLTIGGNISEPYQYYYLENLKVEYSSPPIYEGNREGGGGISIGGKIYGELINSQITDNLCKPDPYFGPGQEVALVVDYHSRMNLINSTIGNNIVEGQAGVGVTVDEGAVLNIYNSVLYGDSTYEISMGNCQGSNYAATLNIMNSDVEGGEGEIINWQNQHNINWLTGNINEDPKWISSGDSAYFLQYNSPCIDGGTPMYEPGMQPPFIIKQDTIYYLVTLNYQDTIAMPYTDLAGNPRIRNNRIDIGAYEFQDTTTSVKELYKYKRNINVYPNPFLYNTFISFSMINKGNVKVFIYNTKGQLVRMLMDAEVSSGEYEMIWDGNDKTGNNLPSGIYIVVVAVNGQKLANVKIVKNKNSKK